MNVFSSSLRGASQTDAPRTFSQNQKQWLRAAQRGDAVAFNQLLTPHQERAYRIAFHALQDAHAANNVMQQVVAHAFGHLRELQNETFSVWLLRLVVEQCAAFLPVPPAKAATRTPLQNGLASLSLSERMV